MSLTDGNDVDRLTEFVRTKLGPEPSDHDARVRWAARVRALWVLIDRILGGDAPRQDFPGCPPDDNG